MQSILNYKESTNPPAPGPSTYALEKVGGVMQLVPQPVQQPEEAAS